MGWYIPYTEEDIMQDKLVELIIGSLLHDIGKVVYRAGDGRNHSVSGYDFLKNDAKIENNEILNSVKYHHKKLLSGADISDTSNAYITYIADNIASASDRRENDDRDYGFIQTRPLESVFNILNGNNQKYTYSPEMLDTKKGINFPTDIKKEFEEGFYASVTKKILDNIKEFDLNKEYINSLLEIMEATCTYVPSSTNKGELADISLFDHVKMTAAIATCIFIWLDENRINSYKETLLDKEKDFYEKKVFLIYSIDVSGIQEFIYTITSEDALKTLRARSFYLELMMEHIVDELLDKMGISRANLIYTGGGHCYMILPNTDKTKEILAQNEKDINLWLKGKFDTTLYIAGGECECSANELKNNPEGSYSELYRVVSNQISDKKLKRYNADDIIRFNSKTADNYERECIVCKRIGKVSDKGECGYCRSIKAMSKHILYSDFFAVMRKKMEDCIEFPKGKYLIGGSEQRIREILKKELNNDENGKESNFVRSYSINKMYSGKKVSKNLWVGNYTTGTTFEELAKISADGINRIAVYRADVDNLGTAFVSGFKQKNGKYETLSRTATLSRQLSIFFKQHMNYILSNPEFFLEKEREKRNITIVYSGGDDIFVVGAWNEVIEFAIDLERKFEKYTQGTLTLSGGVGLYKSGYPVSIMAKEVESLESNAKNIDEEKNAVSLFEKDLCFKWKIFEDKVLGEKYQAISVFFNANNGYGKNFLYNLLELIRNHDELIKEAERQNKKKKGNVQEEDNTYNPINFARYVYILSRMEPDKDEDREVWEKYHEFSEKMYIWMKNDADREQLIAAIYIYVYLTRQEEEKNENQ